MKKNKTKYYFKKNAGNVEANNAFFNNSMGTGALMEDFKFSERAAKYIQDNIKFLEDEDLQGLYDTMEGKSILMTRCTDLLYETGIDPLQYMKKIPRGFAFFLKREEMVIPEGVEDIDSFAFQGSHIKDLYLPQSLVSIEQDAFKQMPSLQTVHYNGTKDELERIIRKSTFDNSVDIICTDGKIEKQ